MDKFDSFASKLLKVIENACREDKCRSYAQQRKKEDVVSVHQARIDALPTLWDKFMNAIGLNSEL